MPKSTFLPHNEREAKGMVLAIGRALAWGAMSLVDPSKLSGWKKAGFWGGVSALSAVELIREPTDQVTPEVKGVTALTVGALIFGTQDLATSLDRKTMAWANRIGIKHPRRWAAALAAGGAFVAYLTEPRPVLDDEVEVDLVEADLPENIREIVAKLLSAVDGYEREVLEAQLPSTQMLVEDPEWPVSLVVDETLPRTLLSEFTWPVTATFERDGRTHHIYLDVADGRLAIIGQYLADELDTPADVNWSWPNADDVTVEAGSPEATF